MCVCLLINNFLNLDNLLFFENQTILLVENLNPKQSFFKLFDTNIFFEFNSLTDFTFLDVNSNFHSNDKSVTTFISQTEELVTSTSLQNAHAIYHYSIPNAKLAYPEPFIAAASFMHTDL